MADSLSDILGNKSFAEPSEIVIIKNFIKKQFQADCKVKIAQNNLIILVESSSLAGALRLELHNLQKLCGNKKLSIRIV